MGFFDKLMGSAEIQKETEQKPKKKKTKKEEAKPEIEEIEQAETEREPEKQDVSSQQEPQKGGQLALDIYETKDDFIIQSTVAGVKPENLDVSIDGDMVSIKGSRERTTEEQEGKYVYQECYWGEFSREVILPEEVDETKAEAKIKNGVLTLKIPKARRAKKKKVDVSVD